MSTDHNFYNVYNQNVRFEKKIFLCHLNLCTSMFVTCRKYAAHFLRCVVMASLSNVVPSENHYKIVNMKLVTYIIH